MSDRLSCLCHSDPDSVAFCVLATDEEYECDIALQIHFTLIQAFCFDNDINVVRVNDIERLADLVGADETGEPKDAHCILVTVRSREHPLSRQRAASESCTHHSLLSECLCTGCLVAACLHSPSVCGRCSKSKHLPFFFFVFQSPSANPWKDPALDKLSLFCEESRSVYDWVPTITLPER